LTHTALAPETPARQVAGFLARFDPRIAHIARHARIALRRRLPTALELVYDNFHALVMAFGSSDRASDCIVSLAVYPSGVSLNFYYGATLPDPTGILLGSGDQNRFIRVESAAVLEEPAVEALICAAIANARTPLRSAGKGATIIKSISARQRPRRVS
jgi:hypothetical protein